MNSPSLPSSRTGELRRMKRHGWIGGLQLLVFAFSLFVPSTALHSDYWADLDNDGTPEQHGDDEGIDTDTDGLKDGFELYGSFTDPLNWDSNNDGYADGDEYHQNYGVNYWYSSAMNVQGTVTFADFDGDGLPNWQDTWPVDGLNGMGDRDNDGIWDIFDYYPDDSWNGVEHFSYNGTEYTGSWSDSDGDSIPDVADMYPGDSYNGATSNYWSTYTYVDANYTFLSGYYYSSDPTYDSDNDGIWDQFDPYPYDGSNNSAYWGGGYFTINNTSNWYGSQYYAGSWNDSDGDGIPDTFDPYPWDSNNGNSYYTSSTSYWSGNYWIDGADTYLSGSYNSWDSLGDSDGDGIWDQFDPYPYDSSNNSSYWSGGYFTINNTSNWYDGQYYAGSWNDSDGDGIPDIVDPYPWDSNNGNSYYTSSPSYWSGNYWIDGADTYLSGSYNSWDSNYDSDNDGIWDQFDPYPYDSSNNSSYWGGGYFTINNNTTWFGDQHFAGSGWSDSDGDGIPDVADPYVWDSINGNTPYSEMPYYWSGNYWISGVDSYLSCQYYSWESMYDNDGDGIYDAFDPYPYDSSNNTTWLTGTAYVDGFEQYLSGAYASNMIDGSDTDNDGLVNSLDPYPNDPTNNTSRWNVVAMVDATPAALGGYFRTDSGWTDSDMDGIADWADPYLNDLHNNTGWFSGGDWWIGGISQSFGESFYYVANGADSDGDSIPDTIDPYPYDATNNTTWWSGDYYVDGLSTFMRGAYNSSLTLEDTDADGIFDLFDPYASDGMNNTSYIGGQYYAGYPFDGNHLETTFAWLREWFDHPENRTGVPLYLSLAGLADGDGDSIPDEVEDFFGLDKSDWSDAYAAAEGSDYTYLERYLAWQDLSDVDDPWQYGQADGIPNVWKVRYSLSLQDPELFLQDTDADGLDNFSEYGQGTNPLLADTDGDGENDGVEVGQGTNPKDSTSNTANPDSDGDGYSNSEEYAAGTNPFDAASVPNTVPPPPVNPPSPLQNTTSPLAASVYLMSRSNSVSLNYHPASFGGGSWNEESHELKYFDSLDAADACVASYAGFAGLDGNSQGYFSGSYQSAYIMQYGQTEMDDQGQETVLTPWIVYVGNYVGNSTPSTDANETYVSHRYNQSLLTTSMPVDVASASRSGNGFTEWGVINERLAFPALTNAEKTTVPVVPGSGINAAATFTGSEFSASVGYNQSSIPAVDSDGNQTNPPVYARFGTGSWKDVWLVRKATTPPAGQTVQKPEMRHTFLRFKESTNAAGVKSMIGTPETVEIVIPEGQDESNVISLHPTMVAGAETVEERLLPVEIVNKDKSPVTELKVADMEHSLNAQHQLQIDQTYLTGLPANSPPTVDTPGDPDRFYVRIVGLTGAQTVSVKLSTIDNPDTTYNDDATEIELINQNGVFESKSQLLVSGDKDDQELSSYDIGADDPTTFPNKDRTHKIQLGGNVRISAIKIDGVEKTMDMRVPVPVKKTVTINAVVMTDAGAPDVVTEVKAANEIYASTGVRIVLNGTPITHDPPEMVFDDQAEGSVVAGSDVTDWGRFISHLGTDNTIDDIHVIYVKQCLSDHGGQPLQGFSIIENSPGTTQGSAGSTAAETGDANNIFISENHAIFFTLAHELGHVLTNAGHYGNGASANGTTDYDDFEPSPKPAHNLMNGLTRHRLETNQIGAKKRIYEKQKLWILNHRAAK